MGAGITVALNVGLSVCYDILDGSTCGAQQTAGQRMQSIANLVEWTNRQVTTNEIALGHSMGGWLIGNLEGEE